MSTEQKRNRRMRIAEIVNEMRKYENEIIGMYVDAKNEKDHVNQLTLDEMAVSTSRAITFGKRFLIG